MADLLTMLSERLAPAFDAVAGEAGVDPVVRPSDRADAQANGALPLAKRLGRNPREVAEAVVSALQQDGGLEGVASVEVAGPGFLNLHVEAVFLAGALAAMAADERLGVPTQPAKRVVVDYSAPNVAKQMHIGHLRSTVIGDALVRMLAFFGHDVVRENHIGDWGRPFGIHIENLIERGVLDAAELDIDELDRNYKESTQRFRAEPDFAERARQRVVKLQRRDPETMAIWNRLVETTEAYWTDLYGKLGVLLTNDDVVGESFYDQLLPSVVERLGVAGLLEHSDGADVVFPPGFTNREGEPLPLIVRTTAGAYTYATSDLACVIDRVERVKADLMLYVVGADQGLHLAMVFAASRMAGWLQAPTEAWHIGFGNVLGPDRTKLRSRSGDPVSFAHVVDDAIDRGIAAVAEKNPHLAGEERTRIGHAVGIGALKYADLSTDRVRDYIFDWDRMLSFDGNTAPYLQYAHTRICSIFRRAVGPDGSPDSAVERGEARMVTPAIVEAAERTLAIRLLGYEAALVETVERYSPHRLCTYLYELADAFTTFYEHCPVLRADATQKASRLALCDLTGRVLAHGLGLLGIEAPEQM